MKSRIASHRTKSSPSGTPVAYAPGHFSALVYRHSWPPLFQPRMTYTPDALRSQNAMEVRMRQVEAGNTGTIAGLGRVSAPNEGWRAKVGIR